MRNRKNGVTKRTYTKRVKEFATGFSTAFDDLNRFVKDNCKGGADKRDTALNTICKITDRYIHLNSEMRRWCDRNGVSFSDFVSDVVNLS